MKQNYVRKFSYCNPTKLYFVENPLFNLSDELKKYGDNVVLLYGSRDEKIKVLSDSL